MNSGTILEVKGLSKRYEKGRGQGTFRSFLVGLFQNSRDLSSPEFWPLVDLNFTMKRGEVLGIIGKNGAGKSTLLRILSGITLPTKGEVHIYGKCASILEIGTGFHPELSGRENIYISGNLLGMTTAAIKDREEEIIRFSGIADFLDMPVKKFSSGMFLRLAFSIASHLDADLLILDEVLSVGDSEFSLKSFRRMRDLLKEGKSVILVSHDLGAVSQICDRCILLEEGRIRADGNPASLVNEYIEKTLTSLTEAMVKEERGDGEEKAKPHDRQPEFFMGYSREWSDEDAPGNDTVRIHSIRVEPGGHPDMDSSIQFHINYSKLKAVKTNLSLFISWRIHQAVLSATPYHAAKIEGDESDDNLGRYEMTVEFPAGWFNCGLFSAGLFFVDEGEHMVLELPELLTFRIHPSERTTTGPFQYDGNFPGPLFPKLNWTRKRRA